MESDLRSSKSITSVIYKTVLDGRWPEIEFCGMLITIKRENLAFVSRIINDAVGAKLLVIAIITHHVVGTA